MTPNGLGRHRRAVAEADLAIVDAGNDPLVGVQLCGALREMRPELPVTALVCWAQPFTPWHLQWPARSARLFNSVDGDRDQTLIGLVSLGLSDQEIGRKLRLSPHTVHHRIELAAWAGYQGVYGRAAAETVARSSSI